ncbi:hypothetical protein JOC95_004152 [Bacillus tianshenii]|uniref:Uncharacterized protein n=1 Tax=Sutcliffiella tianshenii TaxID=1463404 RepID=A0ABS2P5J6_9BACI|nr:hypothetical protein [Bacillus tianshenii]MBM7622237.1 hypothetical protein [Bacillus tianshenii]MCA1319273.1 hypothetical protein [Bacillus tianshenii]
MMNKEYGFADIPEEKLLAITELENQMREQLGEEIVLIAYEKNGNGQDKLNSRG